MRQQFKKLLPAALTAIQDEFKGKKVIGREYQAYISSMGATIQQMGLLPTLAIYADTESGAAGDRTKLLRILQAVLASDECGLEPTIKSALSDEKYANGKLFQVSAEELDKSQRRQLKRHLLDAAVAVKLAIRTFKLSKK